MRTIHGMEYYVGTQAERLAGIAGLQPGHEFYETDTNRRYWYNGEKWVNEEHDLRGLMASQPNADAVAPGTTFWQIDTGDIELSDGTAWTKIGEV